MTDNELYALMKESPQKGRKAVFDEYCNYVYTIAVSKLRNCGNREDIEECVSDIFAEVFRILNDKTRTSEGSLKGIIGTIAKNTAIDTYRKLSVRQRRTISMEEENLQEIQSAENVEDTVEKSEIRRILMQKIYRLGSPDSDIIIQQYFFNRTMKDIAESLSMKEATVQKRSVRARAKLKKLLADEGIGGDYV